MASIFYGNSKRFNFTRITTDNEIIWDTPYEMIFTVRRKYAGDILIKKTVTGNEIEQESDGSWTIYIDAKDTRIIPAPENKVVCVCDVKVYDADGNENTIVPPQDFVILPVATE